MSSYSAYSRAVLSTSSFISLQVFRASGLYVVGLHSFVGETGDSDYRSFAMINREDDLDTSDSGVADPEKLRPGHIVGIVLGSVFLSGLLLMLLVKHRRAVRKRPQGGIVSNATFSPNTIQGNDPHSDTRNRCSDLHSASPDDDEMLAPISPSIEDRLSLHSSSADDSDVTQKPSSAMPASSSGIAKLPQGSESNASLDKLHIPNPHEAS